jgi:ABC-type nitrate/sulfonate/bicarbonate transport system substrate-binding protein
MLCAAITDTQHVVDWLSIAARHGTRGAAAQVAAAGVPPPRDLQIADEGYTVLGDTTELEPNWAGVATLIERRWAAENAPTLTRFLRVQVAATNWLRDAANQEEAAAILSAVTKVDLKYARALIARNLGDRQMFSADARLQPTTLEQVLKDLVAIGDMPALKPVATYTDPSYLERALAR